MRVTVKLDGSKQAKMSRLETTGLEVSEYYNVPMAIQREALRIGHLKKVMFDLESTGGSIDYLSRKIGENVDGSDRLVLLMSNDGSPDTLSEPSFVQVMLNREWNDFVAFKVPSAKDGIKAMADMFSY